MITDVEGVVEEASDVVFNMGLDTIVGVENDDSRDTEERRIARFLASGCKCSLSSGNPCHTIFTTAQIQCARDECQELTHDELDLVVMGQLRALRSHHTEDQGKEH